MNLIVSFSPTWRQFKCILNCVKSWNIDLKFSDWGVKGCLGGSRAELVTIWGTGMGAGAMGWVVWAQLVLVHMVLDCQPLPPVGFFSTSWLHWSSGLTRIISRGRDYAKHKKNYESQKNEWWKNCVDSWVMCSWQSFRCQEKANSLFSWRPPELQVWEEEKIKVTLAERKQHRKKGITGRTGMMEAMTEWLEREIVHSLPTRLANDESKSLGSIFPECSGAPGLWIWVGGAGFSKSPDVQRLP